MPRLSIALWALITMGATPWTGVLAPSRAVDWSGAGVTGGIPGNRTQCVTSACNTVAANAGSSTEAQIEAAWASAAANTYVYLPAGSYSLPCLSLSGVSNVTLRGAGADQTLIATTSACGGASLNLTSSDNNSNYNVNNGPVLVSGTVTQGSTTVTLASVPKLVIGNPILFDQLDSTSDNGGILVLGTNSTYTGPFTAPGNGGPYSLDGETQNARCPNSTSPANCYHQEQVVTVTSCNGVTTAGTACTGTNVAVGFTPPLNMSNWSTANSMSAWWGTSPIQYAGIEDLSVDSTGSAGAEGIYLTDCSNCWVKGIRAVNTNLAHVQAQWGTNDSIVNSYFFLTQNESTSSYGVVCNSASNLLIENNIFQAVTSPVIWNGSCTGTVVGYNYDINNYYVSSPGYDINFFGEHGAGIDTNLLEGNIANLADGDNIHGTANLETYFRNVLTGPQPDCYASGSPYGSAAYEACNSGTAPVQIWSYHRFYNVIGNVLGTTGVNTAYNPGTECNDCVYLMGVGDTVPSDPNVAATVMLWGNADSATGFGSPRFNCNEVPAALTGVQAPYTNACPSSQALPPSFYYSSQPSWWPSGKQWPLMGPDVSGGNLSICSSGVYARSLVTDASMCTGGTANPGMAGLATSNPAMDCYLSLGGLPDGTGPVLSNFSESACYGGSSSGTSSGGGGSSGGSSGTSGSGASASSGTSGGTTVRSSGGSGTSGGHGTTSSSAGASSSGGGSTGAGSSTGSTGSSPTGTGTMGGSTGTSSASGGCGCRSAAGSDGWLSLLCLAGLRSLRRSRRIWRREREGQGCT